MPLNAAHVERKREIALNVFCSPTPHGWRVHLNPAWAPSYLLHCFDQNLEAYPVEIDLEDLDRYMRYHKAEYEKRVSAFGGTELTARGDAADALAAWLSTAFASGIRPRSEATSDS
jgi:hypothetical protein